MHTSTATNHVRSVGICAYFTPNVGQTQNVLSPSLEIFSLSYSYPSFYLPMYLHDLLFGPPAAYSICIYRVISILLPWGRSSESLCLSGASPNRLPSPRLRSDRRGTNSASCPGNRRIPLFFLTLVHPYLFFHFDLIDCIVVCGLDLGIPSCRL